MWPIKHSRFLVQLSEYMDGRLDDPRARTLELHLQGCAACAARLVELRAAQATLRDLPRQEAPRSFAINRDQLREEARQPARRATASHPPALALASAAVALVLAVVLTADLSGLGDNGGGQPSADLAASEQAADLPSSAANDRQAATEPAPSLEATAAGAAPPGQTEPGEPTPAPEARIPEIEAPQRVGDQDGGLDTVRILEIALATGLVGLITVAGALNIIQKANR